MLGFLSALSSHALAQEAPEWSVRLMPYAWLPADAAGFGLQVDGPTLYGLVVPWIDTAHEKLECAVPLGGPNQDVRCGPHAWLASAGLAARPARSQVAPFLGIGIGRRYWIAGGRGSEDVGIVRAGVDFRDHTRRYAMRWEVLKRQGSPTVLVLGMGLAVL